MNRLLNIGGPVWRRFLTVVVPIVSGAVLAVVTCSHPLLAPGLVGAVVVAVWLMLRSYRGAIAYIVSILFLQFDGPLIALALLATGAAAVELLRGAGMKRLLCPQFFLLLAHVALYLVHGAVGGTFLRYDVTALVKLTMLFMAAAAAISSADMIRRTVITFGVVGALVACFSISSYLISGPSFTEPTLAGMSAPPPPPSGSGSALARVFQPYIFKRDDLFAHVMMLPTILGVVMLITAGTGRQRILWGACAAAMVLVMTLARSRTAYVALGVVALLAAWGKSNWQQKKRVLIVVLLILPFIPWNMLIPRAMSVFTQTSGANLDFAWMVRLMLWKITWTAFAGHPLFGVGAWYTYHTTDPTLLTLSSGEANLPLAFLSHNTYLGIAATTGLFGLALYAAVIVFTVRDFRAGYRLFQERDRGDMVAITQGLQFAFIACLIGQLAQPYTCSNFLFWLLVVFSRVVRNVAEAEVVPVSSPSEPGTAWARERVRLHDAAVAS